MTSKIDKILLGVNDYGLNYASMYTKYFTDATEDISVLFEQPEHVGMVSFTGGEDVSPKLYGEHVGRHTYFNKSRDDYELEIFKKARSHNVPMVGICRGSQFLNVMCGGKLIQDASRHAGTIHSVMTYKGEKMLVNSTHHQISIVGDDGMILAHADPSISEYYLDGDNKQLESMIEVESFVYPRHKVIGWQYHPEVLRMSPKDEMKKCVSFVEETLMFFILNGEVNICQAQC